MIYLAVLTLGVCAFVQWCNLDYEHYTTNTTPQLGRDDMKIYTFVAMTEAEWDNISGDRLWAAMPTKTYLSRSLVYDAIHDRLKRIFPHGHFMSSGKDLKPMSLSASYFVHEVEARARKAERVIVHVWSMELMAVPEVG